MDTLHISMQKFSSQSWKQEERRHKTLLQFEFELNSVIQRNTEEWQRFHTMTDENNQKLNKMNEIRMDCD